MSVTTVFYIFSAIETEKPMTELELEKTISFLFLYFANFLVENYICLVLMHDSQNHLLRWKLLKTEDAPVGRVKIFCPPGKQNFQEETNSQATESP